MTHSFRSKEQWLAVRTHFLIDGLIFLFGVVIATAVRFNDLTPASLANYLPSVLAASAVLPCLVYVAGLYSIRLHLRHRYRFVVLALCYGGAVLVMLALGSINFDARLGRGVLAISMPLTLVMLFLHHGLIVRLSLGVQERLVVLVSTEEDRALWERLKGMALPFIRITGMIDTRSLPGVPGQTDLADLPELVRAQRIACILCHREQLRDPRHSDALRRVAFSGVRLVTLADLMEEAYRLVPVSCVDLEWLLHASTLAHRSYVRKWKRLFDVVISVGVGVVACPVLLVGMVWVKLASPEGPVFFRQVRNGRLGRPFSVIKLRTMRVDAEVNGPQWAQANDSRAFCGGKWLRKFRVDEIPQLWNILKGEMSFVGPRPERPEFEEKLAQEIPFFRERLMVAPGLTGWAQVNYPYGATVEDARHKLEYDLYYMKHMTITLDLFILLDTVRIVLGGGVARQSKVEESVNSMLSSPASADQI